MGILFIEMQAFTVRTQQVRNRTREQDAAVRQLETEERADVFHGGLCLIARADHEEDFFFYFIKTDRAQ